MLKLFKLATRPPNFTKLGDGMYVVRTQAGFKQALKEWSDGEESESEGWPKTYPSIVSFSYGYRGYHFVSVNCVHLNKVKRYIKHSDR